MQQFSGVFRIKTQTWYSIRSARRRRSLDAGSSVIPSTITTRSRHSIG